MPETGRNTLGLRRIVPALAFCAALLGAHAQSQPASVTKRAVAPAPDAAGTIVLAEGDARVTSGAAERKAKSGDTVKEGDVLATGKSGELHLRLQDTSFIVLRPNTRFQVLAYRAEGGDDDKGVFKLFTGAVRSISGWIGRYQSKQYVLHTATATIGIRGTDHETRVVEAGSGEGEPGTYDRVYAGETEIRTADGEVSVKPDQAGFLPLRTRERPRLLAAIPAFYRPGPHEDEINRKHEEIQRLIDERREERRRIVAQKVAELGAARAKTREVLRGNAASRSEAKASRQETAEAMQAKREALQRDVKAAEALHEDIQARRAALEEDLKAGTLKPREVRERRKELREKEAALAKLQEGVKRQRHELGEAFDEKVDERYNAAQERAKALHEQMLDARGKRKSVEEERESTAAEIKGMQKQENRRYLEELKADRKGEPPPDPPAKR